MELGVLYFEEKYREKHSCWNGKVFQEHHAGYACELVGENYEKGCVNIYESAQEEVLDWD